MPAISKKLILTLFILISLLAVPSVSTQTCDSENFFYRFNGTVIDFSGCANDGVNNGAVFTSNSAPNTSDTGTLEFDGSNDYVDTTTGFNISKSFSVSTWFNTDTDHNGIFVEQYKRVVASGKGFQFKKKSGGELKFFLQGEDNTQLDVSTGSVANNEWHHGVAVFNRSSSTIKIYVDGELANSANIDTSIFTGNADKVTNLGMTDVENNLNPLDGELDSTHLFTKALTDSEVSNLYNYDSLTNPSLNSDPSLSNPTPSDGASDVSNTTDLSIEYSDPDSDSGAVTFYWQNGTQIQENTGVSSGSVTSTSSLSLSSGTTYNWYAQATDGEGGSTSTSDYSFTTRTPSETGVFHSHNLTIYDTSQPIILSANGTSVLDEGLDSQDHWQYLLFENNNTRVEHPNASNGGWNQSQVYDSSDNQLCTIQTIPQSRISCPSKANNIISLWTFDESGSVAEDYIGGNDGTLYGQLNQKSEGKTGYSYDLDGSDDWIEVGEPNSLTKSSIQDGFTLNARVKYDNFSISHIAGKASSSSNDNYRLYFDSFTASGGPYGFKCYLDTTDTSSGIKMVSEDNLVEGEWYDLAMTYNGETLECFVNGQVEASSSLTGDISDASGSPFSIGRAEGRSYYMDGNIDEVRMYGNALTNSQIEALHSNTQQTEPLTTVNNQKVFWRNQTQSDDIIEVGESLTLSAQAKQEDGLEEAFLSTNETGYWRNYSSRFIERNDNNFFTDQGHNKRPFYDFHSPSSITYEDMTYVVFQGVSSNDPHITTYNHSTDSWGSTHKIADNPLPTSDAHGAPSMWLNRSSGTFHVFYGSHGDPQLYARNSGGFNIQSSDWNDVDNLPGSQNTYPKPRAYNGCLYLFMRSQTSNPTVHSWTKSCDGGDSWSSLNQYWESDTGFRDVYNILDKKVVESNSVFDFPHIPIASSVAGNDVYFGVFNLNDEEIYNVSGSNLGSISGSNQDDLKVLDTGPDVDPAYQGERYRVPNYGFGDYYVLFPTDRNSGVDRVMVAHWNSSNTEWDIWNTSMSPYADKGLTDLDYRITGDGNLEAYVVLENYQDGNGGKRMTRWVSDNYGKNWTKENEILNAEVEGTDPVGNPHVPVDATDDLPLLFSESNRNEGTATGKVWAWRDLHDSPLDLGGATDWTWTNFTWSNSYIQSEREVGWRIWFENGLNSTDTQTFSVVEAADTKPPTSLDDWSSTGFVDKTEATVELTATDSGGSGVSNITYWLNGQRSDVSASSTDVTISEDGNNSLVYRATDNSGNIERNNTEYVALDDHPPGLTLTSPKDIEYRVSDVGIRVSANESITTWQYSLNGGSNKSFTRNTSLIGLSSGEYDLSVYGTDEAGNTRSVETGFTVIQPSTTYLPFIASDNSIDLVSGSGTHVDIQNGVQAEDLGGFTDFDGDGVADLFFRSSDSSLKYIEFYKDGEGFSAHVTDTGRQVADSYKAEIGGGGDWDYDGLNEVFFNPSDSSDPLQLTDSNNNNNSIDNAALPAGVARFDADGELDAIWNGIRYKVSAEVFKAHSLILSS